MTMTSDRFAVVTPANHVPGPKQGQWTYAHYAALPNNGKRYEIVNGVLYTMLTPDIPHQEVLGEIFSYLRTHVKLAGLGLVRIAPFDVELAPNVVVQPDVLVVLNTNLDIVLDSRIIGTPNLVVEVASPGTATHDRREKYDAYANAGVPEYWIADPIAHTVEVFILETGNYYSQVPFAAKLFCPRKCCQGLMCVLNYFSCELANQTSGWYR